LSSFLIKARFFPGFDAFATNFSGQSWHHVTATFVFDRLRAMLQNLNIVPVLLGCVLLALFDIRYVTGLVLLTPVYVIHLLAVRPEHGYFTLYFALPWLFPCSIWLAVFARRSRMSKTVSMEAALILAAALALSAPVQSALGAPGQYWYVARWAFERPVGDIRVMQDFIRWVRKSGSEDPRRPTEKQCVSQGIAGLIPNEIHPDEVLTADADLRTCRELILLSGDMQYPKLSIRAAATGFHRLDSRSNIELWILATPR
jgi:hypothetical protein